METQLQTLIRHNGDTLIATFAVSSGKWYFEGYGHTNSSHYVHYGIISAEKMNANKTQPESEINANANGMLILLRK